MQLETSEQPEMLRFQPSGAVGIQEATLMLEEIRRAEAGVEFDFSAVETIDFPILQLVLATVATMRRRGQPIVVKDNDSEVLRCNLDIAGISPDQAGLSERLLL